MGRIPLTQTLDDMGVRKVFQEGICRGRAHPSCARPTRLSHHVLTEAPDGLTHNIFASPSRTEYAADPRRDGLITAKRQDDGTENHSHAGQERSPNDVAEPVEAKI